MMKVCLWLKWFIVGAVANDSQDLASVPFMWLTTGYRTKGHWGFEDTNGCWFVVRVLGQFGAHWFYLRRTVPGILALLFCWTGIPAIIAFVNGLQIAYGSREQWSLKYNNGVETPPVHWVDKILVIVLPVLGFLFWIAILNA